MTHPHLIWVLSKQYRIPIHAVDEAGRFIGYITADRYLNLTESEIFRKLSASGVIVKETKGFPNQGLVAIDSNPVIAVLEMDTLK